MPKRKSKAVAKTPKTTAPADRLAKALKKRTKAELVDVIVEIAKDDRGIMRQLESHFAVEAPA